MVPRRCVSPKPRFLESPSPLLHACFFARNSTPSPLDASIYSLLTIISILPAKGDNGVLRTTLERCPTLTRWYKSHEQ